MKTNLTIEFPNQESATAFASWLCNSGEQSYWEWMEYRNEENAKSVIFHYHGVEDESKDRSDPTRYKPFMSDNIIRTSCVKDDE